MFVVFVFFSFQFAVSFEFEFWNQRPLLHASSLPKKEQKKAEKHSLVRRLTFEMIIAEEHN